MAAALQTDVGDLLSVRAANLRRLARLFSLTEGSWALAIYDHGTLRAYLVDELRRTLAGLPVHDLALQGRTHDPLALLRELTASGSSHVVVSLHSLSARLADLCRYLDLEREQLARQPQHLLLWLTADEWRKLAQLAPNFYSRLSSVYDFTAAGLVEDARQSCLPPNAAPAAR